MAPRKKTPNSDSIANNGDNSGHQEPNTDMQNQFQQMMQAMLDQQRQANENQARIQAQALEA